MKSDIKPIKLKALWQILLRSYKDKHSKNIIITVLVFSILLSGVLIFSRRSNDDIPIMELSEISEIEVFLAESKDSVTAYGLYIDGAFIAAVEEEKDIDEALDTLLDGKVSSLPISDVTSAQFLNEIKIENTEYDKCCLTDCENLKTLLGIEDEYSFTFRLKNIDGEALSNKLSVLVFAENEVEVELAYGTSYVDTDLQKTGYRKTLSSGTPGVGKEKYELVYIDDELVQTNYITTEVISAPKAQIIERGVLSADRSVNSLGILKMPYDGKISSGFGWRSLGYHEGIDIVANSGSCYGDDAYAAASGVVYFSGWSPGYGNNVRIDHGDGLVTIYAHFSTISVKQGDIVSTGDVVGQIGTTGRVTGPHLHFEVQLHGIKKDPLLFLKMN
ncbi:MAG: hypothetical protein CVU97_05225 [Firmicutes bacterium HGW-Firmicutes-21]|nr:MAG: hypothetical protein CVU97_05225 [Firmicutes bacterium HGW-Firmicutes-21]